MADKYTDITNGNDSTGDGSAGTPYQTIQKAIDNANGGDVIWVGDSGTNTLSSQLNWTSFGGVQDTSLDNRLVVRGWDYSGGAGADGLAVISGGGTLGSPLAASKGYVTWYHLHFDDYTTLGLVLGGDNIVYECKFTNIDAGYAISNSTTNYSKVYNCFLETVAGGIYAGASTPFIVGCTIKDHSGNGIYASPDAYIANNILISAGGTGIYNAFDRTLIFQNTIIGDGSTASIYGIHVTATSEAGSILGNLIKGWSGTSNAGIYNADSANQMGVVGYNHFDDNTANMTDVNPNIDLTANDSTSAVTFTNAAGGDYSIDTGNTGYDAPFYGFNTQQYMDTGAAQRANTGGGLLVNPGMSGGMRG